MQASLIYDKIRWEEKAILKAAEQKHVDLRMVDAREMDMNLAKNLPEIYGNVTLQRCTSYYRGLHSTAYLEYKGQKVVNDLQSIMKAGNKMLTSLEFVKNGIPTPDTSVSMSYDTAMRQFTETFGNRAVLKPVTGSWGRMLALLNDRAAAMAVLEDRDYMYPLYSIFYLQEFVKKQPRDLRIFVIGDKAVAGIYRYHAEGDWRTNAAIGGKGEKCEITEEIERIAVSAAKCIGNGIFGVDLMESDQGYTVHEINSTTEFRSTATASGVDIAGAIVDYLMEV